MGGPQDLCGGGTSERRCCVRTSGWLQVPSSRVIRKVVSSYSYYTKTPAGVSQPPPLWCGWSSLVYTIALLPHEVLILNYALRRRNDKANHLNDTGAQAASEEGGVRHSGNSNTCRRIMSLCFVDCVHLHLSPPGVALGTGKRHMLRAASRQTLGGMGDQSHLLWLSGSSV